MRLDELPHSGTSLALLNTITNGGHIATATALAREVIQECPQAPLAIRCVASLGKFGNMQSNAERDMRNWTRTLYDSKLEKFKLNLIVTRVAMLLHMLASASSAHVSLIRHMNTCLVEVLGIFLYCACIVSPLQH